MRLTAIAFSFLLICEFVYAQEVDSLEQDQRQVLKIRDQLFTTRAQPKALPLPKNEESFHFVIFGDRTGGQPSGLKFLRQAVRDTNLMDPDLVMTVGDLIQGYNRPKDWLIQMREYKGIMDELKMPWYPVAGNHDIYWDFRDRNRPNIHHEANYEANFGPLWYSFRHKECGFVVLYSDEGIAETGEKGFNKGRLQNMSPDQLNFLEAALAKLKECKQIFVFLHHPRWLGGGYEGSNWPEVHKRLVKAGNVKGVFGGHIHHMTYQGPVDGIEYFTLAATGAHLGMDAPNLGYLHHFNVVTVRENEFSVATIPVGTVIDPKTFQLDFLADVQRVSNMRPSRVANRLPLSADGSTANNYSLSFANPGKYPIEVTVAPKLTGNWQVLPDHQHVVIPPGKTDGMSFHFYRRSDTDLGWADFSSPLLVMNVDYLHTSARIRLPQATIPVELALATDGISFNDQKNQCLELRGVQSSSTRRAIFKFPNDCARINSSDVRLDQGPFTVEAWINPTKIDKSRAIVAKTQSSEFGLFLHDGRPQFDVHIDGNYVSPRSQHELPVNQWTHVAGVYDGQKASLYVNGERIGSLDGSGKRTTNVLPLFVGADPDGFGNPTREFAGRIDEVRLSNSVRYTKNFSPSRRFIRDENSLLLLHFDRAIGPFLLNDSQYKATIFKTGQAAIAGSD